MNVCLLGADAALAAALRAEQLTVLDADGDAAREVAGAGAGGEAGRVDPADRQQLVLALEGIDVLVDALASDAALDAALVAGCAYVGVGTPSCASAMHEQYAAAGVTAVVGCGSDAPSIVARLATGGLADELGMPRAGVFTRAEI